MSEPLIKTDADDRAWVAFAKASQHYQAHDPRNAALEADEMMAERRKRMDASGKVGNERLYYVDEQP